jgi:Zn finger protein HypA/HybF involved in hydrogenase expression
MKEKVEIECIFCKKGKVNALFYPSILQTSKSRAAGRTITKYYMTKERYEVISDCPNCGKKAKEIQKALQEGKNDPEREKKIMDRLKQQGIMFREIKRKI